MTKNPASGTQEPLLFLYVRRIPRWLSKEGVETQPEENPTLWDNERGGRERERRWNRCQKKIYFSAVTGIYFLLGPFLFVKGHLLLCFFLSENLWKWSPDLPEVQYTVLYTYVCCHCVRDVEAFLHRKMKTALTNGMINQSYKTVYFLPNIFSNNTVMHAYNCRQYYI